MKMVRNDKRRRLHRAGLALALTFAAALAACGNSEAQNEHAAEGDQHAEQAGEHKEEGHSESEELTLTAEEAERAGVKVEEIRPQALGGQVVATATIRPDQDKLVRVAPRIEGRITSAPAKLGDRVRAGQALATLDSVAVGEAHAAWVQAQAELRIAQADFERAERLSADEIIARKDFLRARSDRDKAAATLRAAEHRLRLLGGNPSASGAHASAFAVTAPFAGTVIEKSATLGELASPNEPLFTVADLSSIWIQADLPEAALARVHIGANAKVGVSAYPNETFVGRVDYIGAVVSKDTRTVAARIVVPNEDGRLKPQMFATATIEVAGEKREAISLPADAIVLMQGQPTVFVLEHGNYEMRVVEPGERIGNRTVVKAGIEAGEQVVTTGAYALKARKLKSQLGHGH
ncbi:MAG: efflux RND transporter periplasmic adaptor subunit [Burkholderiaceae bacterium]|jgi:cobalt-zinc-cadmium efflux system membrane fusion protein|nr:efflux RND transporter periplasmic adaptor subunit [Burkholderiaceae bacterium]